MADHSNITTLLSRRAAMASTAVAALSLVPVAAAALPAIADDARLLELGKEHDRIAAEWRPPSRTPLERTSDTRPSNQKSRAPFAPDLRARVGLPMRGWRS